MGSRKRRDRCLETVGDAMHAVQATDARPIDRHDKEKEKDSKGRKADRTGLSS